MNPERSRLEEVFRELSDEELLRRCASDELTEFALPIALAELRTRGLEPPARTKAPPGEDPEYLGDWVIVARYLSYLEIHLLQSALEGAGIPVTVSDAQLVQTDALLGPALRGASLRVPAARMAEAREVLAAIRRGDFQLADDFDPGPQQPV